MFDLYTNFDVIFLVNLTDKIHYQIFDSLGRVVQVLVDNDAKTSTGVSRTDNDGETVLGIDQVQTFKHNVKGEIVTTFKDNDVNGIYESREDLVLDANGRVLEYRVDKTNDGTIDNVTKNTLNAKGEVIESRYYNQTADGRQYITSWDTFERDANGYTTKKASYAASGAISVIETYENDSQGRVLKKLVDNGGNGTIERAETYTRDSNGYIMKTEVDVGNNGSVESSITYERDVLGRTVKQLTDNDNNGQPDSIQSYTLDVYGRNLKTEFDTDADGVVNRTVIYERDANGNIIYEHQDTNGNGIVDTGERTATREFNVYGQITVEHVNWNRDTATSRYDLINMYNEKGQRVESWTDYDFNGKVDKSPDTRDVLTFDDVWTGTTISQIRYNFAGNFVSRTDWELNGAGQKVLTYVESANGNQIMAFGANGAGGGTVTHSEDMTSWTPEKLARFNEKLTRIVLSDATASSTLSIDSETVAKVTAKTLQIEGDATDTLNLGGFNKSNTSDKSGFDKYTAAVDGSNYTVYVDTDIDTNIIG